MKLQGISDKGLKRVARLVKGQDMGKTWDELSPEEQAAIEEEEFQLEQEDSGPSDKANYVKSELSYLNDSEYGYHTDHTPL